jgi:Ca2+/Na+ antiporter
MIDQLGRAIAGIGLLLLIVGGLMILIGRFAPSGKLLPGDIVIRRDGFTLYFPLATMIVVSLLLSGAMWLIIQLRR